MVIGGTICDMDMVKCDEPMAPLSMMDHGRTIWNKVGWNEHAMGHGNDRKSEKAGLPLFFWIYMTDEILNNIYIIYIYNVNIYQYYRMSKRKLQALYDQHRQLKDDKQNADEELKELKDQMKEMEQK